MSGNVALPENLRVIDDMHLGDPHIIATYLLLGDAPAIVDPGPTSVLPALEAGLVANGLSSGDLQAIVLTHIHFDHAGATGTLVARHPHLRVYVHQRGAPHMAAPEKLIRSATRIYGADMDRLWGAFEPVPEGNITALAGGETVELGGRRLQAFDAPGHASHHLIYFEEASGAAFVGDTAAVRLPGYSYILPATPPPDIDLEAWNRSLDLLRRLDPRFLMLTHFGAADDAAAHVEEFRERLARWAEFVRAGLERGDDEATQMANLRELRDREIGDDQAARDAYQHASSTDMSWQGLARYWRTRDR